LEAPHWLYPFLGADRATTKLVVDYHVNDRMVDYALAVSCFVLVNRWVRLEKLGRFEGWGSRWLARVGVISYSLYLTHVPVITLIEQIYGHYHVTALTTGLRYLAYVPLCLGVAWGFFTLIEKRFLNARPSRVAGGTPELQTQKAA